LYYGGGTSVTLHWTLSLDTWYNLFMVRDTVAGKVTLYLYDASGASLITLQSDDETVWCSTVDYAIYVYNMNPSSSVTIAHMFASSEIADSGGMLAMIEYGNTAD